MHRLKGSVHYDAVFSGSCLCLLGCLTFFPPPPPHPPPPPPHSVQNSGFAAFGLSFTSVGFGWWGVCIFRRVTIKISSSQLHCQRGTFSYAEEEPSLPARLPKRTQSNSPSLARSETGYTPRSSCVLCRFFYLLSFNPMERGRKRESVRNCSIASKCGI